MPIPTSFERRTTGGLAPPEAIGSCEALRDPAVFARKSITTPSEAEVTVDPKVRRAPTHGTFLAAAARPLPSKVSKLP